MRRFFVAVSAFILMMGCVTKREFVSTFTEPDDPVVLSAREQAEWDELKRGLHVAWGSVDRSYARGKVPSVVLGDVYSMVAWKGERVSTQVLLWTAEEVKGVRCAVKNFKSDEATLPASIAQTRFVRYTLADTTFRVKGPAILAPDLLDTLARFDVAARSVRPVWITVEVPQDAREGIYSSKVVIRSAGGEKEVLTLRLEVQKHVLPTPEAWRFHLDLWQHPSAVARAHGVEMWSDAHFEVMKPLMKRLAAAGQKVITATLNKDPWHHQCYDAYDAMIRWTLKKEGTWSYDYRVFDRWVEMMLGLGINKMINCYSIIPWNCELDYFDEAKGKVITVRAEPGTPVFAEMWRPFLLDFKRHLEEKGWLKITNIAVDERSPKAMDAAAALLNACVPEMGFALADNKKSYKRYTMMRDVCVALLQPADHADIEKRREQGYTTTFYVCNKPVYPNTLTYSQPYEAELLGWYGVAWDYDGMLRWAYNSWPKEPHLDSRFSKRSAWGSGDTYLVYPYNRSSIRFERMIDGIEVFEKVHALRAAGVDVKEVERVLEKIRTMDISDWKQPWQSVVQEARAVLNEVSRK